MRFLALLAVPFAAVAAAAPSPADRGPGIAGERRGDAVFYAVDGFDRIGHATAAAVEVRVGPAFSVRATGPAAAFRDLRVAREGRTLEIGRRWRDGRRDDAAERQMRILVTLPRLSGVAVGGSGRMTIDRVDAASFDAAVGGSGGVTIGTLKAARAEISIGGSGGVRAAGAVDALTVNVGGSGGLDGADLVVRTAEIAAAGSGTVRARVDGRATVSSAGSGSVDLGPAARCSVSRVGSGRVRCGA